MQVINPSTSQYNTYKISNSPDAFYSFVFNDIMGLEQNASNGVHVEDIKLALRGHVRDGYKVQSSELWHCLKRPCGVLLLANKHYIYIQSYSSKCIVCIFEMQHSIFLKSLTTAVSYIVVQSCRKLSLSFLLFWCITTEPADQWNRVKTLVRMCIMSPA